MLATKILLVTAFLVVILLLVSIWREKMLTSLLKPEPVPGATPVQIARLYSFARFGSPGEYGSSPLHRQDLMALLTTYRNLQERLELK